MRETSPTCVLRWLERTLEAHQIPLAARRGEPILLAACLPERERWIELASELFKAADGVLVDATAAGAGIECGDLESEAPDLVGAVQAVLAEYNREVPSAEL